MKKIVYTVGLCIMTLLLSSNAAFGQETTGKVSDEKQKQVRETETLQKKQQVAAEESLKKAQVAEKEAQLKVTKEKELAKKIAEIEKDLEGDIDEEEMERVMRDYEIQRIRVGERPFNSYIGIPDEKSLHLAFPYMGDYYFVGHEKSGSSWNYSRQVLEATFTNEFTMDAGGDNGEINLSVSGNCAEGSISVAIITPDGNKLSEVVIDANGSLNWRKSFDEEESKWESGKWIFRVDAKKATGNFRISMTGN